MSGRIHVLVRGVNLDQGRGDRLLHDFNRAQQYRLRECETERLRGPAVDDEVELRGLLDRQLSGLGPFQDSVDVDRRAMILVRNVRPVAGQEPLLDIRGSVRDGRQPFLTAKSAILLMSTGMVLSG